MKSLRQLKPRKRPMPKPKLSRHIMSGGPYSGKALWLSTGGTLPFKVTAEVEDISYEPGDPDDKHHCPMVLVRTKVKREFKGYYDASDVWVNL